MEISVEIPKIAGLVLYGTDGISLRLRICLYRLMSGFNEDLVVNILKQFSWTLAEFSTGFKSSNDNGTTRDAWVSATISEEIAILRCFLKFKRTKNIASGFLLELAEQKAEPSPYPTIIPSTIPSRTDQVLASHPMPPLLPMTSQHEPREKRDPRHILPKKTNGQTTPNVGPGPRVKVPCNICGKGLSDNGSMLRHVRDMHSGKIWKCTAQGCVFVTKHPRSLERHDDTIHAPAQPGGPAVVWPAVQQLQPPAATSHLDICS